ncbi:type II secretion system protein, partial [bacterium]|nr:type II secretion system protein [bacterium]
VKTTPSPSLVSRGKIRRVESCLYFNKIIMLKQKQKLGFTLVELIVVITILAIL